jgi:hypothetical protein
MPVLVPADARSGDSKRPIERIALDLTTNAAGMDITGFVVDHMGHFTVYDLPGAVFAVVMAALLTAVMVLMSGGEARLSLRELMLWSAASALALVLIRGQLPVAVAFLALVIIVRPDGGSLPRNAMFFSALIIGLGCGSGAALVTALLVLPFAMLARWSRHRV